MFDGVYDKALDALIFFSSPLFVALVLGAMFGAVLIALYIVKQIAIRLFRIRIEPGDLASFSFWLGIIAVYVALAVHAIFGKFEVDYMQNIRESAATLNTVGRISYQIAVGAALFVGFVSILIFLKSFVLQIGRGVTRIKHRKPLKNRQKSARKKTHKKQEEKKDSTKDADLETTIATETTE